VVRSSNDRSIRRRGAQRDLILRAAARLFRERGIADTGMREIAAAADLSPANIYYYFKGKDEILFYCQDRSLDSMLAAIAGARQARGPVAGRLDAVLRTHVSTLLGEVDGASAHLLVDALPPPMRARIVAKRDRYERALRQLVAGGVKTGEFSGVSPALVTRAMLGALNMTALWFKPEGQDSADTVGRALAAYLVRGLHPSSRNDVGGRKATMPKPAGRAR
jgi:AcrR family transcriptional regulator